MKRPPRTVVLAAALISGVAVAALILCTTLFLRSYRSAVVEGARTNSAQVVSQVAGAVDNYVNTMDSAVGIVLEQLDSEPAMRDAFLNAFLTARGHHDLRRKRQSVGLLGPGGPHAEI